MSSTRVIPACLALCLALALQPSPARARGAGVGGGGNTADLTTQLEFARQTSLDILHRISIQDLYRNGESSDVIDLYRSCREAMYGGVARTRFEIVDTITGGEDGHHAVAERDSARSVTIVSRAEIDRLVKLDELSATFLVMVVMHEATHDCVIGGHVVDDSQDTVINKLALALYDTAHDTQDSATKDLDFLARVHDCRLVALRDLSPATRRIIAEAYLDYLGDWLYSRNESLFKYRPAPASRFDATAETSFYPGWAELDQAAKGALPDGIRDAVQDVMKPTFESKDLFYALGDSRTRLPTKLGCRLRQGMTGSLSAAVCELEVSWDAGLPAELRHDRQTIDFELDAAGQVVIRRIRFF